MAIYISENTLQDSVEFFRSKAYKKPEQIGLFFYFKAIGLNRYTFSSYPKWGSVRPADKRTYLRTLYDLAGNFDVLTETGQKRTALFPFSISNPYKPTAFYNGGTEFSGLGSRISDTLDNSLVSTFIQRNTAVSNEIKLADNYIELLLGKYIDGHKISLELISAWYYKLWNINMPENATVQDFQDICVLGFLKAFHISKEEFDNLFFYGRKTITSSSIKITGEGLRSLLAIDEDCAPQIKSEPSEDYMSHTREISASDAAELLELRGTILDKNRIYEILEQYDNSLAQAVPAEPSALPHIKFTTGFQSEFLRNRIFFGAPGTGKSYTLNKEKDTLLTEGGEYERVTFHPDYSYANFVGTYKPVPCQDSDGKDAITYTYVPGPFMRTLVKALENSRTDTPKPYLLMIEEINRANVAAVFGEVFQLLDRDDDEVSEYAIQASEDIKKYLASQLGGVPSDYNGIQIPDNMFIWATMNSADQGVFPMDTAFKRRWDFTYLGIDDSESGIAGKTVVLGQGAQQREVEWNELRKAINAKLIDLKVNEDKLMGPYFLAKKSIMNGEDIDAAKFIRVFKNKVIMYLFDDAAKRAPTTLFDGCDATTAKQYSKICQAFDEKGIYIFGQTFGDEIGKMIEVPLEDDAT